MTFWRFRHRVPAGTVLFLLIDGLLLLAAMYYGVALRYAIGDPYEYGEVLPLYPRAIAYSGLMLAILGIMGFYTRIALRGSLTYPFRFMASFLLGAVLMAMLGYVVPALFLGRGSIALTAILACATIAVARYVVPRFVDLEKPK